MCEIDSEIDALYVERALVRRLDASLSMWDGTRLLALQQEAADRIQDADDVRRELAWRGEGR